MSEVFQERGGQKSREFGESLWRWQYQQNPCGSIVIVARDGDMVCGYYHLLLVPLVCEGRLTRAAIAQDVGTKMAYRKRGVFREMGVVALESLRKRGIQLVYAFPNDLSLPSFLRNHAYSVVTQVPAYIMPLRLGSLLENRRGLGAFGGVIGSALDPVYRFLFAGRPRLRPDESVAPIERFDDEVAPLMCDFGAATRVHLHRSPAYLNWRFFDKPTKEYSAWGLYSGGKLCSYVVTREAILFSTTCLMLLDYGFRKGSAECLIRLISSRVAAERPSGAALALTMGLHPVLPELRRAGFSRVPERFSPRTFNLVLKELGEPSRPLLFEGQNWTITMADWDVF
jgi:hypothetical protein